MTDMLLSNPLFKDIDPVSAEALLQKLTFSVKSFEKGDVIFKCGETTDCLGIVLEGSVIIENNDLWGNRNIIGKMGKGKIFGEAYSCLENTPILIEASANEASKVLFLNINKLLSSREHDKSEAILIRNLLSITARKNVELSKRILYTSPKTIRGRLMTYLSDLAKESSSLEVTIPFTRQMLSDYLEVERSALSNEISKMQRDGLISYRKNTFRLNEKDIYI